MSVDRLSSAGRIVPARRGRRQSHAHRLGHDLRGPAARFRGHRRDDRGQADSRPPLPPGRPLRPARAGPTGMGRRPALQHRLPPAPHRACRPRGAKPSSASSSAGSCPNSSIDPSPSGRSGSSRASKTATGRSLPKPTMPSSTAISGTDLLAVIMDVSPGARSGPPPWTGHPRLLAVGRRSSLSQALTRPRPQPLRAGAGSSRQHSGCRGSPGP